MTDTRVQQKCTIFSIGSFPLETRAVYLDNTAYCFCCCFRIFNIWPTEWKFCKMLFSCFIQYFCCVIRFTFLLFYIFLLFSSFTHHYLRNVTVFLSICHSFTQIHNHASWYPCERYPERGDRREPIPPGHARVHGDPGPWVLWQQPKTLPTHHWSDIRPHGPRIPDAPTDTAV